MYKCHIPGLYEGVWVSHLDVRRERPKMHGRHCKISQWSVHLVVLLARNP